MSESVFRQVDPIPRGMAYRRYQDWFLGIDNLDERQLEMKFCFFGGPPRCPVCLNSSRVQFNGRSLYHKHKAGSGFHCNKCKVWWKDIGKALCFICQAPYNLPKSLSTIAAISGIKWENGSCYHLNETREPFCPKCSQMIDGNIRHSRRTLRRLVEVREVGESISDEIGEE